MTGKNQDAEFRHPDTVAYLQSLTKEEAEKQPPLVRESGGVITQYWREGGRVRCREVAADELSGPGASETEALLAAAEAEFGRLLPKLKAELAGGGVPDLDAFETCQCRSKIPQKCRSRIPQFLCVSGAIRFSRCGSPFWAGLVFSAGAAA